MFSVEKISVAYVRNANAACILALLRTVLITLVRRSGYDSLKVAQEIFAHDLNKAIRLLYSRPFT
jgi:hypothetical protein